MAEHARADGGPPRTLKFLCHNLACHYLSKTDLGLEPRLERLEKVCDKIVENEFDVVLIQELYTFSVGLTMRSAELDLVQSRLTRHGYTLSRPPNAWIGMDTGLCVFTKSDRVYLDPSTEIEIVEFDKQLTSTSWFPVVPRKSMALCTIKISTLGPSGDWNSSHATHDIRLINCHLNWQEGIGSAHLSQLRQTAEEQQAANPSSTVVVCGDFNQTVDFLHDGFQLVIPAETPTHDDGVRYDQAFVSAQGPVRVVPVTSSSGEREPSRARIEDWRLDSGHSVSDHRALIWEVDLKHEHE